MSSTEYFISCTFANTISFSGRNDDYVLKLAAACRALSPDVRDSHLFTLETLLLELRQREGMDTGMLNQGDQKDIHIVQQQALTA